MSDSHVAVIVVVDFQVLELSFKMALEHFSAFHIYI